MKEGIRELKLKTKEELKELLDVSQRELGDLRFKITSKQLKNVRDVRKTRKKIAQILTLLKREK